MKRADNFYCLPHTKKEQGVFIVALAAGGKTREPLQLPQGDFWVIFDVMHRRSIQCPSHPIHPLNHKEATS
jgi:hypothetical protein